MEQKTYAATKKRLKKLGIQCISLLLAIPLTLLFLLCAFPFLYDRTVRTLISLGKHIIKGEANGKNL